MLLCGECLFDHESPRPNPQGGDVPFRLRWTTTTGAASEAGGSQWGSASDGRGTVFLQNANRRYTNVTLVK